MNLVSKGVFSRQQYKRFTDGEITQKKLITICLNYIKFLSRKLELWMFVPCDKEGKILKEPYYKNYEDSDVGLGKFHQDLERYQKAKYWVLFKGLTKDDFDCFTLDGKSSLTIEDLERLHGTFELTPTTLKEFGLN